MRITNKLGLPAPLVKAVTPTPRIRQPRRISITDLSLPPQLRGLRIQHENELEEDAADRIFALLGSLLHDVLEKYADSEAGEIAEEKLEMEIDGWTVVGKYDLSETEIILEGEVLTDWKLTSIYSLKDNDKPEWEEQINCYIELLRRHGRTVTKAQIIPIGRDWSKSKAQYSKDYPQQQVIIKPIRIWSSEEAVAYIRERIRLHELAEQGIWENCTKEERWYSGEKFALMKKGNKKATKLFDTEQEAKTHQEIFNLVKGHEIQFRAGVNRRCASYCNVADYCDFWQVNKPKEANNGTE